MSRRNTARQGAQYRSGRWRMGGFRGVCSWVEGIKLCSRASVVKCKLEAGMEVKCMPPFVSVGKGNNFVPEWITSVRGVMLGIAIGSEYNS
eukprot:1010433-Pleurochrysis_carterae.AAC.1